MMHAKNSESVFNVDLNSITFNEIKYENVKFMITRLRVSICNLNLEPSYQKMIKKIISRFQLCEKLKTELTLLSNYYDDRSQEKFIFGLDDDDSVKDHNLSLNSQITRISNERLAIENVIGKYYAGYMTYFARESLCLLFSFAMKKDKENFKATIFSSINNQSIKEDKFINPRIDDIFDQISIHKSSFDEKLNIFLELLRDIINECLSHKTQKMLNDKGVNDSMVSIRKTIMKKSISIFLCTSYQYLPELIFNLFYYFQNEPPSYNQMLICTKSTTISRISSFLSFYRESNQVQKSKKDNSTFNLFLLINPQNLVDEVSKYLINHITKYSSETLDLSRLVLLSTNKSSSFIEIYKEWEIDDISKFEFAACKPVKSDKSSFYMIYTEKPRTGKSHLIMNNILTNYPKHTYHRIIVDSTTSLTQLISSLKEAVFIDGFVTCYHFNIVGYKNEQFSLFIIMLFIFGTLNDGISAPFVLNNKIKTVFFFEFGANPAIKETSFIENVFPIGKFMEKLQIPPDRDFFTFDEYNVIRKENYSTIVYNKFGRNALLKTSALAYIKNHFLSRNKFFHFKKFFIKNGSEIDKAIDLLKNDPKCAYDNILILFKQDWIPKQYKEINPLISQLDDISHIIVKLTKFIFSSLAAELDYSREESSIKYIVLLYAFETAIINCGMPYLYPIENEIEIDSIRLNRIKKFIESTQHFLVIVGLNYDDYSVRLYEHQKSQSEEYNLKFLKSQDLDGFYYSYKELNAIEKDNILIFMQIEDIFSLRLVGNSSLFSLCILCWDQLTNQEKEELKILTNNEKEYFKKLKETPNCSFRKNPMFYTPNPSKNCQLFIDLLASIFRNYTEFLKIKDNEITTHEEAVDYIRQYVFRHSHLMTHSYTLHNLEMLLHIEYRVYSQLPTVLMGETGSGKTYSIDFLKEVFGPNTMMFKLCLDEETEEEYIKQYVKQKIDLFNGIHSKEEIESNKYQIIFFFDEVNTSSCLLFIKDLVIDRFLNDEKIPDYVKFICAMKPRRLLPNCIKQKFHNYDQKTQNEISNLVYNVKQIPESFSPFILPVDASRALPHKFEDLLKYDDLSEFEKICEKIIDNQMNAEPFPIYSKTSTGKNIHFSLTSDYSVCFNFKFFSMNDDQVMKQIFETDALIKTQKVHEFISRLNAYAGRLFTDGTNGIYKDNSFMSIREPERCVQLMKWFYKKGMLAFSQKNEKPKLASSELFKKSFMLAFAVTYWLQLSDQRFKGQNKCDRDIFINKIIKKWSELIDSKEFNFLNPILKPPTFDEWINKTIKYEQRKITDMLVNDDEGISKNDILCENIWATYISLSNNIPLWIIGPPGTSKSLSVKIVLEKLSTVKKTLNVPELIYKILTCSSVSRSELIAQMIEISLNSKLLYAKESIKAVLIENVVESDFENQYHALRYLSRINDEGFDDTDLCKQTEFMPITFIGLSNHRIDLSQLNRSIYINRNDFSQEQKQKIAFDIFSSTSLSLFKASNKDFDKNLYDEFINRYQDKIVRLADCFHNCLKPNKFISLRDLYSLIKLITCVLLKKGEKDLKSLYCAIRRSLCSDKASLPLNNFVKIFDIEPLRYYEPSPFYLIEDKFNEYWYELNNPISRHLLLITEDLSKIKYIVSTLNIQHCLIYADNISRLLEDEWKSDELKQFLKSMVTGGTIIFIGNHPCFNCLYDILNLRYETIHGENYALISIGSETFRLKVHPNFKLIIVVNQNEYNALPSLFLSRFEKIFLNHNFILDDQPPKIVLSLTKYNQKYFLYIPDILSNKSVMDSLLSFSIYNEHSVWITKDGIAHTIGDNSCGQICRSISKEHLKTIKDFTIYYKIKESFNLLSAVCGSSYTLYLASSLNGSVCNQLIYNSKLQEEDQPILLNTGDRNIMGLFGGRKTCAAIDSKGDIFVICKANISSLENTISSISLPNKEKSVFIACCDDFIFALSAKGKVYSCSLSSKELLFEKIPELEGINIIDISGTYKHCLAVSDDGKVFGRGSNIFGQLGIESIPYVNEFTLITSLQEYKIAASYAGYNHSLFRAISGRIITCGNNPNLKKSKSNYIYSPTEASINSEVTFCIAGDRLTAFFVACEPPPNSPNKKITNDTDPLKTLIKNTVESKDEEIMKLKEMLRLKEEEISLLRTENKKLQDENKIPKKSEKQKSINKIKVFSFDEFDKYKRIGKPIGRGATSEVYKVSKQLYAVKIIHSELIKKSVEETTEDDDEVDLDIDKLKKFFHEYEVLNSIDHPNIIKTFGFFMGNDMHNPAIILEYCPHNLKNWLEKLNDFERVTILIEISDAMTHVHKLGLFHRDLKPENILLDNEKHVHISDFGLCTLIDSDESFVSHTQGVGTFRFMAPEILNNRKDYDEKVDIYAFGLVFFLILTKGKYPSYDGVDVSKGEIPEVPKNISPFSRELIKKCWAFDPKMRPSFEDILNSFKANKNNIIW